MKKIIAASIFVAFVSGVWFGRNFRPSQTAAYRNAVMLESLDSQINELRKTGEFSEDQLQKAYQHYKDLWWE